MRCTGIVRSGHIVSGLHVALVTRLPSQSWEVGEICVQGGRCSHKHA